MKNNLVVLVLTLTFLLSLKQEEETLQLIPSEIKQLDSLPGDSPYLTKNNSGETIVSWVRMQSDSSAIFCYAVSKDDGKNFGNIITVTSSTNIYAHAENIPKVIFKPSGEIIAVWGAKNANPKNKYSGLIYYAQSFDNGKSWSKAKKLVTDAAGYDQRYSDVVLLKNGEAGIIWLDNRKNKDKEGSAVFFAVTEGNKGFKNEKLISEPSCQCCRTSMFADSKGNIHALYRGIINDSIRDMIHIVSTNGGLTFTSPKKIYNDNWALNGCPHTGPDMTENKEGIHFAWYTGARSSGSFYASSADNGNTYMNRDNITSKGSHPQMTSLTNNELIITWDESFEIKQGYTKRIGIELRTANGKHQLKKYITPDSMYASYPVITGVKNNGAILAYCLKKGIKNYIGYQRINSVQENLSHEQPRYSVILFTPANADRFCYPRYL